MTQTIHRSDRELQTSVTDELLFNPSIDAADLAASVNDGVVTLSGEVDSLPERHAAKRAALRVRGVKTVTDNMVVRNPGTAATKDADVAMAASQMLDLAVDVPPNTVKANVRDNMITLSGTVTWQFQREAAARAVMYIRGITDVTNDILLTAAAPRAGVQDAIEAAILRNAQLDPSEITVAVADSELTLRGTVGSWAQRCQAEYVAWSAPGVTSVKNDLAVTS
jgi:osmotically-inducible protein OsmY